MWCPAIIKRRSSYPATPLQHLREDVSQNLSGDVSLEFVVLKAAGTLGNANKMSELGVNLVTPQHTTPFPFSLPLFRIHLKKSSLSSRQS
jgi:hypothetical protein